MKTHTGCIPKYEVISHLPNATSGFIVFMKMNNHMCLYETWFFFLGIIIFYGETLQKFTVHELTERIILVYNKVQDDDLNVGTWQDVYSSMAKL